jgi:indole-3-glycerol phosphate synthase
MTILEEINEVKKEEVKKLRQKFTLSRFEDSEFFAKPKISFFNALNTKDRISIVAEIKKASPSKGIIKEDFNHTRIAEIYMENKVDAISVLTDVNFFQGHICYLNDIANFKSVPLLRKDFIIDEYQIFEAKANGADVVLLIAELLSKNQIADLTAAAKETDLEVLLELHSFEEFQKIDFSLNLIVGINNRDLKTFNVDIRTTKKLGQLIPKENLLVAESGIKTRNDIEFIKSTNATSVLIGEHLMSSKNITDAIKELREWCYYES